MSSLLQKHAPSLLSGPTSPSQLQNPQDTQTRRRVHTLLSQNFELRERVQALQGELKKVQHQKCELKDRVRLLLEELANSDKIVEGLKEHQHHLEHEVGELEVRNGVLEGELASCGRRIEGLVGHVASLETEIKLLGGIKEKYMVELGRSRSEIELLVQQKQMFQDKNVELIDRTTALIDQIQTLQSQVQAGKRQLHQYQQFVLSKVQENNPTPTTPLPKDCQGCIHGSRLYLRYRKYKQKAGRYKQQRDQLLEQMGRVYKEMDCSTLRVYYSERE